MKTNTQFILLTCLLLCFCACGRKPYPQSLIVADSLASVQPDSAITLLNTMKDSMKAESESTQMYYQLLCIKANDKAYIRHTSDSLILSVLHYYIKKDDKRHLPEAYYYAGRVYRDLGDAPQALDYFEKALATLSKNKKHKLKIYIYSQIGTLFLYQGLYNEALEIFKKRYAYNIDLKDSVGMVYTLRDIAGTYCNINQEDSSIYYYQAAYDLGKELKRPDLTNMVQSQIASLYIQSGKYDLAKSALQDALTSIKYSNKSGVYSIAAKLYHKTGMTDSAIYYYKALLDFGTIYAKENAHRSLAEITMKGNNCQLAIQHIQAYLQCVDSIQKITYTESLHRMHSLYNYQLREKENNQLKSENQKKADYLKYGLIGFAVVTAFFFSYYQYNKRKKQELKYQLQKAEQIKVENYKKSQLFIKENNVRIQELEKKLNDMNSTNEILRKEIQDQKELLCQETRRAEIEQSKQEKAQKALSDSSIYQLLKKRLLDPQGRIFITTEEWIVLRNTLKGIYPNFFEKLSDIYTFNEFQLHVCILIKGGFSPSEIAKLTEHPKETITSTRRRLYTRIFQEKGKPEDWDNFITSL
ncbi:MAG: tetratricopeptide repeat protein [Bacteroides cellulosilyticus]|nr:tetratricopeptide repeat protein [Bacteroides cellulosilyticus]